MRPVDNSNVKLCNDNGGQGIGSWHVCRCVRKKGHPLDDPRPHGCTCGAMWGDPQ